MLVPALIVGLRHPAFAQKLDMSVMFDERALFAAVGAMYKVDPELLAAIAAVESGGRPDATSPKGAAGLMQLMGETARRFHVDDPYDPAQNALGAARFIAFLRARQMDPLGTADLPTLLAAYNAGENAVRRFHGIPPFEETRDYVRKVLWLYLAGVLAPRTLYGRRARVNEASERFEGSADRRLLERLSRIRRARTAVSNTPWKSQTNRKP
jgi:Transglycosylase SLT domain